MYFYHIQRYTTHLTYFAKGKNTTAARSSCTLQGKSVARIASLLTELSQSPHKCNGQKIKFAAML